MLFGERRAMSLHSQGKTDQAYDLYDKLDKEGKLHLPNAMVAFSILLLKRGEYQRAAELLRKMDREKKAAPEQRRQMLIYYSIACWKLGNLPRAIELMEELHQHGESGMIYSVLGTLLNEEGDYEKALSYNQKAVEYDDEDAICLDNLAQTYYRLGNDKDAAKPLFEKALSYKEDAIDTNYFLALYDIEAGNFEEAAKKLDICAKGNPSPLNYATAERQKEARQKLSDAQKA